MGKCVSFEKKSMFSVKIGVYSPPLLAVFRRHFSISQTQLHQNLVFCKPFFPAPPHTCRLTPEPVDMERKKFQDRTCMVFCPRCPDRKIGKSRNRLSTPCHSLHILPSQCCQTVAPLPPISHHFPRRAATSSFYIFLHFTHFTIVFWHVIHIYIY